MADQTVSMPNKEEILRQEEELEKKNKWLYPTVIAILIVFFVVGFTYGLMTVLRMEGAYPPADLKPALTEAPETKEAALALLTEVSDGALAAKPKMDSGWRVSIDTDSIETDGPDKLRETLQYLAPAAEDAAKEQVPGASADFSEGIDDIFLYPAFSADEIESFTCTYIYYCCISCGQESTEPLGECDYCGSEYPYQMRYRDNYEITLELKPTDSLLTAFFMPDAPAVERMLREDTESTVQFPQIGSEVSRLFVRFHVNRATNELKDLTYGKEAKVTAEAAFTGPYESFGTVNVSANAATENKFSFTWPALELNTHRLVLELKESNNLQATLICSDPTAYDAVWTTSDESVVKVDDEGYLKAAKTAGKAVVTASYEFNGKTYSDSCEIVVCTPVESMQLNKRHLSLAPGAQYTLTAKVSPKNATVQTATFYTTDETVATVDENGVVTAVAPGTATVYALSDDGYYKSSCEVTVK